VLVPNSSARNCKFSLQVHNCRSLKLINIKAFTFVDEPHVMVQVGDEGDAGVVEIQDLLFTSTAPSAGDILMEWNVAQTTPGSAAMWGKKWCSQPEL